MDRRRLERVLSDLKAGKVSVADAMGRLRDLPYEDLGFAKIDGHRDLRRGFPEVVYCPGKTPARIVAIVKRMSTDHGFVLATRADPSIHRSIRKGIPSRPVAYFEEARIVAVGKAPAARKGHVLVVTAGT